MLSLKSILNWFSLPHVHYEMTPDTECTSQRKVIFDLWFWNLTPSSWWLNLERFHPLSFAAKLIFIDEEIVCVWSVPGNGIISVVYQEMYLDYISKTWLADRPIQNRAALSSRGDWCETRTKPIVNISLKLLWIHESDFRKVQ